MHGRPQQHGPTFTPRFAAARQRADPDRPQGDPMTTSTQQTVLTEEELRCLLAVANGSVQSSDAATIESLAAKGMIDSTQATISARMPRSKGFRLSRQRAKAARDADSVG